MNKNNDTQVTARLVGEDNTVKQLMFSLITGDVYSIELDEMKNMDKYQIPLKQKPSASCKKCYGRMHVGFNTTTKVYMPCRRCVTKCVDFKQIANEEIQIETVKNA